MTAATSPSLPTEAAPSSEPALIRHRHESIDDSERADGESAGKTSKEGDKRGLFNLLKQKNSDKGKGEEVDTRITNAPSQAPGAASPRRSPQQSSMSAAVSPQRHMRSPSPGLHSPASSLIFERNVQEQPLPDDLSAAIPHHIQTEDHIPAVLEASSLAITDNHLNPDEVEIVMHSAHQPAAMAVAGSEASGVLSGTLSPVSTSHDDLASSVLHETDEGASTYGALDNSDVRRLSFISFADVVQSEHVDATHKESALHSSFSAVRNRSPSPLRSPASSHDFGTSPPDSGAPSVKGLDLSKISRLAGSPPAHGTQSPPLGGELMVETMRQALRKTHSGDLSGARIPASPSLPLSAVSLEDAFADDSPFSK